MPTEYREGGVVTEVPAETPAAAPKPAADKPAATKPAAKPEKK